MVGAVGVVVGLYGAWLLLSRTDTDQLVSAVLWLGGGVVLHDAVLAPVVVVAGVVAARALPGTVRASLAVVAVVLGSLTLLSLPVLFGREPANPTLLDRDYTTGWLLVASIVVVVVACGTLVLERRRRGAGPGGR
ncbi:hypothetical protein GCM10009623_36870 [Nocardioides aestuarii]